MFGEKPITLADSTSYVSYQDPSIDWDRVIAREHERDPKLRERVSAAVASKLMTRPDLTEDAARRALEQESVIERVSGLASDNPAMTLEEYLPKDGQRVTVFRLGVVQRTNLARIQDETAGGAERPPRPAERFWRCFLDGIRAIDNWGGKKPATIERGDVSFVDPKWLAETFVGPLAKISDEVGLVIWVWNRFSESDAKK